MAALIAPPPPPAQADVDAGVIEDARARQLRHRQIGAVLLIAAAAAAAAGLMVGMSGGGGGAGTGLAPNGHQPGGGAGAANIASGQPFPGAPPAQSDPSAPYGACARSAPNRYLPPDSGCVSVRHIDVSGDGRADLVLVYSRIAPVSSGPRFPGSGKRFDAKQAFLKVVQPNGATVVAAIPGAKGAAFASIGHFNTFPGKQIFLETSRTSSGAGGVGYSLYQGRLVAAGAPVYFGGDSGTQAGFDCLPGNPPRFIQRTFVSVGTRAPAHWRETDTTYAWHGPKLVKAGRRTSTRRFPHSRYGWPPKRLTLAGPGCNQHR